ncbi:MAG: peptidoglycan DD-metalloendopeptidase family protein [Thermoleophilaceae bacterium]|nr:peptidoglycan DD-metalloendopeptidase family protein [Thermoleophilaceae bacterium]
MLAARLVELYKDDRPDLLTVVLEADGFADLLEQAEFLDRIARQDAVIVERVRQLRDRARAQAKRLAALETAAQRAAQDVLRRRDNVAATRDQLAQARADLDATRADRRVVLASVRGSRRQAQEDLRALEAEQVRVAARLRAAATAPAPGAPQVAPIRPGSGQLIWPIDGSITSPFGPRWGRLHAGLDIGAPEGTPIRAAASGRVVLAGWQGGYGNYTCIQHDASLSTCYAHQSRLGTTQGATVAQGEVMGYVGNTGNSFGAHLHFEVRVGGSPVDPLGYL